MAHHGLWLALFGLVATRFHLASAVSLDIECKLKVLAYNYAKALQPERAAITQLVELFDALELETGCGLPRPSSQPMPPPALPLLPNEAQRVYVDVNAGNDQRGNGSEALPFLTVEVALAAARALGGSQRQIVLRAGVYYLNHTISLSPSDSNLSITNYPNEAVWISGGVPLSGLQWSPHNVSSASGANIWVTEIPAALVDQLHEATIPGLMTLNSHIRLPRARFPNGDQETRNISTISGANVLQWLVPPTKLPASEQVYVNATVVAGFDSSTMPTYNGYANGRCKAPNDPECPCGPWTDVRNGTWSSESYWCSQLSAGGWANMDQGNGYWNGPVLPQGMVYDSSSTAPSARFQAYQNITGALLVAWRAQGWFVNMYEIDRHDKASSTFGWRKGGFQGGRGWQVNGTDGAIWPSPAFYIENVLEELDAPGEWFFNRTSRLLYLWWNASAGIPPPSGSGAGETLVATRLARLVEIVGSKLDPVVGVTLQGLGFRDTRYTYMEPWGVPSGGDWALHRGGSVFLEGTENTTVQHCLFKRVDGNGLFLSGYNRFATASDNEFVWTGDCAMAAWGYTDEHDGTGGEQPRETLIQRNVVHELGIFQLQSSMWFQAKTALTTIADNLFFNGPRSGININDGFGGGNTITRNVIINTCRNSGGNRYTVAHSYMPGLVGPINTWDRQLYLSDLRYGLGQPSFNPLPTTISFNYIHATYGASQGVDNDGSSWYAIANNTIYGEGLKMDYGGHDSSYSSNLNVVHKYDGQNCINVGSFQAALGPCVEDSAQENCNHAHVFEDNRCLVLYTEVYGTSYGCGNLDSNDPGMVRLRRNSYFTPGGNATFNCAGRGMVTLPVLQAHGIEQGSTGNVLPNDSTILAWANETLGGRVPAFSV